MGRFWLMTGCLLGALSVALGAFGAHYLRSQVDLESLNIFDIATRYIMYHAFALIALGLWSHWEKWASNFWAGTFFLSGILLFSGSLYAMIFVNIEGVAYLTPTGGVFLILGWLNFVLSVFQTRNRFL